MDLKLGHKYPSPSLLRLYITKAILKVTTDEIAESKSNPDEPFNYTFGVKALDIINEAITNACDDWDKDGIYAGILDDKVEQKLREIEDA